MWLLLRVVLLPCRHSVRFHLLGLLSLLLCTSMLRLLLLRMLLLLRVLLPSRHSQRLDTLGFLRFLSRANLPRSHLYARLERPIRELRLVGSRLLRCFDRESMVELRRAQLRLLHAWRRRRREMIRGHARRRWRQTM